MFNLTANKRPIFYALVLVLSTYLLVYIKPSASLNVYLTALGLNLFVFFLEIYTLKHAAETKLKQLGLPIVNRYASIVGFTYHFILPLLLFASFNIFIFYTSTNFLIAISLILIFFFFSVLFINIRAYEEDKFKLELATHFIYTFAVIFSLFSLNNAFLNIAGIYEINLLIVFIVLVIFVLGANIANFIENLSINPIFLGLLLLSSLLTGVAGIFLFNEFDSVLRASFTSSLIFYFFSAIIHHKQDGTLRLSVVLEYAIITALSFVMLFTLN